MPNFTSQDKGTFFPFDPDDKDLGGVTFRELGPEEHARIEKITSRVTQKFKRGAYAEVKVTDDKLFSRLMWDYCIVSWIGVQLDGQDQECTTGNKVKMMNVIDFAKFASESIDALVEVNKTLKEASAKNSETTSNGS